MRVATWIRVSDERQAKEDRWGIPRQKAAIQGVVIQQKHAAVKSFQVEDVSGSDVMDAPETHDLMRLMEEGEIQGVVAAAVDRLARPDDFSAFHLLKIMRLTGTLLITPERTYDPQEAMDAFQLTVLGGVGGLEKNLIKKRTLGAKYEARDAKRFWGGRLPQGVAFDRKTGMWSYTSEAQRVLDVFERILAGNTNVCEHARYLGDKGLCGIYTTLRNEIYTGWIVYKHHQVKIKGKHGKQASKRVLLPEDQWRRYHVIDEPLISEAKFQAVQRILSTNTENRRRDRKTGGLLYNGFVFCARCGSPMTTQHNASRNQDDWYYKCMNRKFGNGCDQPSVRADQLEPHIDDFLSKRLTDRAYLSRLALKMENNSREARRAGRIERLEADYKKLEKKRTGILENFDDGYYTKQQRDTKIAALDADYQRISAELLREREALLPPVGIDQLVSLVKPFHLWRRLKREERRKVLAVTIPKMRIDEKAVVSFFSLIEQRDTTCLNNSSIRR